MNNTFPLKRTDERNFMSALRGFFVAAVKYIPVYKVNKIYTYALKKVLKSSLIYDKMNVSKGIYLINDTFFLIIFVKSLYKTDRVLYNKRKQKQNKQKQK